MRTRFPCHLTQLALCHLPSEDWPPWLDCIPVRPTWICCRSLLTRRLSWLVQHRSRNLLRTFCPDRSLPTSRLRKVAAVRPFQRPVEPDWKRRKERWNE